MTERDRLEGVIRSALAAAELEFEEPEPGSYLVTLTGTRKLATNCLLVLGEHSLVVQAFFVRRPDENEAAFYRWLLERNARMYAVAFAVGRLGDVYLVGRLPLSAVTEEEIDHVLGSVLSYADESFNAALELGFAGSIRREWAWRLDRGESVANLAAFAHLAPDR